MIEVDVESWVDMPGGVSLLVKAPIKVPFYLREDPGYPSLWHTLLPHPFNPPAVLWQARLAEREPNTSSWLRVANTGTASESAAFRPDYIRRAVEVWPYSRTALDLAEHEKRRARADYWAPARYVGGYLPALEVAIEAHDIAAHAGTVKMHDPACRDVYGIPKTWGEVWPEGLPSRGRFLSPRPSSAPLLHTVIANQVGASLLWRGRRVWMDPAFVRADAYPAVMTRETLPGAAIALSRAFTYFVRGMTAHFAAVEYRDSVLMRRMLEVVVEDALSVWEVIYKGQSAPPIRAKRSIGVVNGYAAEARSIVEMLDGGEIFGDPYTATLSECVEVASEILKTLRGRIDDPRFGFAVDYDRLLGNARGASQRDVMALVARPQFELFDLEKPRLGALKW